MKRNTSISKNLQHKTMFIDPRSGTVLKEGSDPMGTIRDFKSSPQVEKQEDDRIGKLEKEMSEIKT